jgi:hypothetical protein
MSSSSSSRGIKNSDGLGGLGGKIGKMGANSGMVCSVTLWKEVQGGGGGSSVGLLGSVGASKSFSSRNLFGYSLE